MAPVPSRLHPPPRQSHEVEVEVEAGQASDGEGIRVVVVDDGGGDERCRRGDVEVEASGGRGSGGALEREVTTDGRVSVVVAAYPGCPGQGGKLQWQQQRQRTEKRGDGRGGGGSGGESGGAAVVTPGDVPRSGGRRKRQRRRDYDVESADASGQDPKEASSYVWRVLAYLTFINPFLCLFNLTYTVVIVLLSTFTFPIRYSLSHAAHFFSHASSKSLARLLLLHLRFIHPSSSQQQQEEQQQQAAVLPATDDFSAHRAAAVHLGSAALALALILPSAGLGLVWLYTEVLLGESNDRTGVEYRSVMALKRFWEEYVLYALKMKTIDS